MGFWRPTRRKLKTFGLLVLAALTYFLVMHGSDFANKTLRSRLYDAHTLPSERQAYAASLKSALTELMQNRPGMTPAVVQRDNQVAWAFAVFNNLFFVFFAYLTACAIHRRQPAIAPTPANGPG